MIISNLFIDPIENFLVYLLSSELFYVVDLKTRRIGTYTVFYNINNKYVRIIYIILNFK